MYTQSRWMDLKPFISRSNNLLNKYVPNQRISSALTRQYDVKGKLCAQHLKILKRSKYASKHNVSESLSVILSFYSRGTIVQEALQDADHIMSLSAIPPKIL